MTILDKMKSNTNQSYLIALIMYIIGIVCDVFSNYNSGVKAFGYVLLIVFVIYSITLIVMWDTKNEKCLRAAKVSLTLIFIGMLILLITSFYKMLPTFLVTLVLVVVLCIVFIKALFNICFAYFYDEWE